MIKYYCDICKKDTTREVDYRLQIRRGSGFLEREELICENCKDRILKYINRILREDK